MIHLIVLAALALPHLDQHGDPLPPGAITRFGTVRFRVGAEKVRYAHALSPDGKYLAVEDRDGIHLWDTDIGRVAKHLPWRTGQGSAPKFGLCFSPDGKRLARLAGRVVAVWDLATGTELFDTDYKSEGEFQAIGFVPGKDQLVVTADQRPRACTLDARTGKVLRTTEFEGNHWALEPAGPWVLDHVGSNWSLYDPNSGREGARLATGGGPHGEAFVLSKDGKRAWIADIAGILHQFDVAAGTRSAAIGPPPNWKSNGNISAALSHEGLVVHLAPGDHRIYRWNLRTGRWLEPIPNVTDGTLLPHPDGKRLLILGKDGVLHRYDLTTRKELLGPDGFEGQVTTYPSPEGTRVAVVSGQGPVRLDMFDRAGRFQWSDGLSAFGCVPHWSPDGRRLAVVEQKVIRLLDPASGESVRALDLPEGFTEFHLPVAFAAGGDRLFAPLDDGKGVVTFDTATGRQVSLAKADDTEAVAWSSDGRTLLYADKEKGIRLFELTASRFRGDWVDPPEGDEHNPVGTPGFTPDGSSLVTWELERPREAWRTRAVQLVLRNPRTGAQRGVHELGLSPGFQWAMSPDGLWLAVGTRSGKVELFDLATGHGLGRWEGHRDAITSIHFFGPGQILTASADLTVLVWNVRARTGPARPAWEALCGQDGNDAWKAVWALAADPKAPNLLRSKIAAVAAPPADRVKRWLADLGANRYAVREAATKELQTLGRLVEPELLAAREQATSEEVRTRLDGLLAHVSPERSPAELVQARAVAAMEAAGTPAARKLLAEWAAGASGARLTVDAKAALIRLGETK
jgi:WD40 repeat protein